MKKILWILALALLIPSLVFAKPQQMKIKSAGKANKESQSKAVTKNIRVADIEDPAAHKAVQEILNYLDLPYKK